MWRSCRDEKVVVLLRGPPVRVLVGFELRAAFLCRAQVRDHAVAVDAFLQSKINAATIAGVEQVIALVLRVVHAEVLLDVFRQRMDLEGKIAAFHGVQKVKADGKLGAKAGVHGVAEKSARMLKNQVNRRYLDVCRAKAEQETVLLRNAIETPRKVRYVSRKLTYLFHPLAAPRSRIKEGNQPKRLRCGDVESTTKL